MRFAAFFFVVAGFGQEAPEIRGTVIEYGPKTGIAGATVTLVESAFYEPGIPTRTIGSVVTNARGEYSFKPGHYGDFYIDAKMPGYSASVDTNTAVATTRVMAMNDQPKVITLTLMRPGSLTGRVVDSDGRPLAGFTVSAGEADRIRSGRLRAVTNEDGYFKFPDLPPGPYLVRTIPKSAGALTVMESSTDAEAETVDEDFEASYWPGGASDPRAALPLNVEPAGEANIGTLKLRRVPFYRVRVSMSLECEPGERRNLQLLEDSLGPTPTPPIAFACAKEFLLRNVTPGIYTLALSSGTQPNLTAMGIAKVTVGSRNTSAFVTLAAPVEISGQIKTASGSSPNPAEFYLNTHTFEMFTPNRPSVHPDTRGHFTLPAIAWPRQKLVVESLNPNVYVKDMRYNNQSISDGLFEVVPGATLEITVADGASAVSGKVLNGGAERSTIFLTRWPRGAHLETLESAVPFQQLVTVQADGQFHIASLPPGEYRIAALTLGGSANILDPAFFRKLMTQARTIVLEPGATKNIEVALNP